MHPLRPLADDLTTIKGFASVTSFVLRSLRTERGLVAVVGIEPWGGLSAAIVSSLLGLRYHYSSMELMHPRLKTALLSGLLRMSVRLMVGRASTIVVQDPDRAALLRKLYGVVRREVVLMPIGSIDPKNHATTTYLHDRLGVPPDKAIVIYAGSIRSWAFVRELAVSARGWPDPWVLVIHGFADPESDYYKSLLPLVDNKKVFLSTSIVEWSELDPLLCSARMSIAAFSAQDENSARVFFSSNKLANYARCGLPLLITHSEQSEGMLKQIRWGETFREFSEIPSAISRIEKDYDQYRQCCSRAFDTYYDLNRHGVDFIKAITRGRRGGAMTTQGAQ
jgi:hypothetical protein